jgi:hypothetical protein
VQTVASQLEQLVERGVDFLGDCGSMLRPADALSSITNLSSPTRPAVRNG